MKYFVQVNGQFMISIEAESAIRAEHAFLDLDGIQYAMAYDDDMRKTDCFRGALLGCTTMSLDELVTLSGQYTEAWQAVGKAKDTLNTAMSEVERIREQLERAMATADEAERAYSARFKEAKGYSAALHIEEQ